MGKGEHPLADGLMRKNVIEKMRGGLDHAARTARGAKAPAFAGERDQVLMLAPIALDAQEPVDAFILRPLGITRYSLLKDVLLLSATR